MPEIPGRVEGEGPSARRPMPPRPAMSDLTPAPVERPLPPPTALVASRYLWGMSFVIGVVAILVAFVARDAQIDELTVVVGDLQPNADTEATAQLAGAIFAGSLSAVAVVILLEVILLASLFGRRPWIRFAQLGAVILHGAITVVAVAFIAIGDQAPALASGLIAQAVLAGLALVTEFLPGAGGWLRRRPKA